MDAVNILVSIALGALSVLGPYLMARGVLGGSINRKNQRARELAKVTKEVRPDPHYVAELEAWNQSFSETLDIKSADDAARQSRVDIEKKTWESIFDSSQEKLRVADVVIAWDTRHAIDCWRTRDGKQIAENSIESFNFPLNPYKVGGASGYKQGDDGIWEWRSESIPRVYVQEYANPVGSLEYWKEAMTTAHNDMVEYSNYGNFYLFGIAERQFIAANDHVRKLEQISVVNYSLPAKLKNSNGPQTMNALKARRVRIQNQMIVMQNTIIDTHGNDYIMTHQEMSTWQVMQMEINEINKRIADFGKTRSKTPEEFADYATRMGYRSGRKPAVHTGGVTSDKNGKILSVTDCSCGSCEPTLWQKRPDGRTWGEVAHKQGFRHNEDWSPSYYRYS